MGDDEDTVVPVPADEGTTVVEREDPEERTVVVERGDPDERTVVVTRRGRETDNTVVIDRRRRGTGLSAPDPDSVLTVLPSRRGIGAAPVGAAAPRPAVEPRGPNAVEAYEPRGIAPAPPAPPPVPRAEGALRPDATAIPSVARRSRASGAVALLAFAGACVVSVVGIVAVIVWFVRS